MPSRHFEIRRRFPTLATVGVAAQHFSSYTNPGRGPFTHDVLYCSFIARGRVTHRVGDEEYVENAGSLSVVGYGVPHEILTGRRAVDHYNLYLDPARHPLPRLHPSLDRALYRLLPLHPALAHRLNRLTRVSVPDPDRMAGYLETIEGEQGADDPGRDTALLALLQLVLLDLARAVARTDRSLIVGGADDPQMEEVRRRLDEGLAKPWSMTRLARAAGITPEHFSRRFARYAGCSPSAYLRSCRLQAAMGRLRSSDESIIAIAGACGFLDLAYFNRAFRRALGVAPGVYRRRFRSPR